MTKNWIIQDCDGSKFTEQHRTLEDAAAAYPNAHSIWLCGKPKKLLAQRCGGLYWHLKCWRRYQAVYKEPSVADAYMVSGAETMLRDQHCRFCGKSILE